jgi:hypothetical protein
MAFLKKTPDGEANLLGIRFAKNRLRRHCDKEQSW